MKNTNLKHLVSMALCCAPMLAAPLLFSVAGALGWRTGVLGVALTVLAVLACPVSMGLMMWQMSRHSSAPATPSDGASKVIAAESLAPSEREFQQLETAQTK
jgi:hypothetical protein